jgi:hypothetical protein
MHPATRWTLVAIVVLAIVGLVAWARNDPGVGDREPDPPSSTVLTTTGDPAPIAPTETTTVPVTT